MPRPLSEGGNAATPPADFESQFHHYWERVCNVLMRLVGDPAEAEDLALDVFWRLYRRPPREGSNLAGWLYRVAANLGLNALRARKRRHRYEEEAGIQILEDNPDWDPAAEIERSQERQRVRRVLAEMKPRLAQALILRHSGLSYAEVAAAIGVSAGSVGTILARAERDFAARYNKHTEL